MDLNSIKIDNLELHKHANESMIRVSGHTHTQDLEILKAKIESLHPYGLTFQVENVVYDSNLTIVSAKCRVI